MAAARPVPPVPGTGALSHSSPEMHAREAAQAMLVSVWAEHGWLV